MNIAMVKNSSQNNTLKNRRITNIILGFLLAVFVFVPFVQNDLKAEGEVTLYVDINVETEATSRTDDNATFKTISNALSFANNGDTIKLISNVKENITVASDKNIMLDLNGYVLKCESGTVITNNGILTINDSNHTSKHYYEVDSNGKWCLIDKPIEYSELSSIDSIVSTGTKVEVEGGCITGGSGTSGGAIYNASGASLNLYGGVLIGNTATYGAAVCNNGYFNMQNALIIGNYASYIGGGLKNSGNINITSGIIRNNTAKNQGGAIACDNGSLKIEGTSSNRIKFLYNYETTDDPFWGGGGIFIGCKDVNITMNAVAIKYSDFIGNKAERHGGAIYFRTKGQIVVENCKFDQNHAKNDGGAVSVDIDVEDLTIKDSTFTNNIAGRYGGAIFAKNPFTCSGTTEIKNNSVSSTGLGGGIYVEAGTLTLANSTSVTDNTINNTTRNNLYLCSNKVINIYAGFNGLVGISTVKTPTVSTPIVISGTNASDYSSYLFSDSNNYFVKNTGSGSNQILKLNLSIARIGDVGFSSVQSAINSATSGQTVQMLQNSTENVVVDSNITVTLDLNGYVLSSNKNPNVGEVASVITNYGILTIKDSNPNANHYFTVDSSGTWVLNDNNKTNAKSFSSLTQRPSTNEVILINGGVITGGRGYRGSESYYEGGGISNKTDAILNIEGCFICGNTAGDGAGIYNKGTAKLVRTNIVGNRSGSAGGGIENVGTFYINDGTNISFNDGGNQGGSIYNKGTLFVNYDYIDSNNILNSTYNYVNLCCNFTRINGGGILNGASGCINVYKCNICSNICENWGGGVTNHGTAVFNTTNINNNTSLYAGGGGINTGETGCDTTTTLINCEIINNKAKSDKTWKMGGGIRFGLGELIFSGKIIIKDNHVDNNVLDNLFIFDGHTFTIDNTNGLITGSNIGVKCNINPASTKIIAISNSNNSNYSSYFVSDDSNYLIINDNNVLKLCSQIPLSVSGTIVHDKMYDGSTNGEASISIVKGIKLEDLGKVEVNVASVVFDSTALGKHENGVTVTYSLSGEAKDKYLAPAAETKTGYIYKEVNVKADNLTMTLGDAVPNFTAQVTGLEGSDQVSYSFNSINPTKQGVYKIIPSNTNIIQGNYKLNFTEGTLIVNPAENDIAKTDPVVLNNILNYFASKPEYVGKKIEIELNVNNNTNEISSFNISKVLEVAGQNNEYDAYETNIYLSFNEGDTIVLKPIKDTEYELIPIEYNFDFKSRYDIHVWRTHVIDDAHPEDVEVEEITTTKNKYGEFVVFDYTDQTISVWARKYSTYTVTYKEYEHPENSTPTYQPVKTCVD